MKAEIEKSIKSLTEKSVTAGTSHEAMQYAQAALNLVHALEILSIQRIE